MMIYYAQKMIELLIELLEVDIRKKERQWLKQNAEAIREQNHRIDRDGVFSDGLRQF